MNDPVLEALNRAAEEVTPADVDQVIAYLRKTRQNYESGVKPKKEGEISRAEIMAKLKIGPAAPPAGFIRRV